MPLAYTNQLCFIFFIGQYVKHSTMLQGAILAQSRIIIR